MRQPSRSSAWRQIAASSASGTEVPVGLDGVATMTPRVLGPQCCSTSAASSWYRVAGVVGISRTSAPKLDRKCRLAGYDGSATRTQGGGVRWRGGGGPAPGPPPRGGGGGGHTGGGPGAPGGDPGPGGGR